MVDSEDLITAEPLQRQGPQALGVFEAERSELTHDLIQRSRVSMHFATTELKMPGSEISPNGSVKLMSDKRTWWR